MVGVCHACQQSHSEDPGCGLPRLSVAQPPLQLAVDPAQAEASQRADDGIALQPETLNLQGVRKPSHTDRRQSLQYGFSFVVEDAKTSLIAHHSQQQGSADIQVGSPSKKQRINHQHGRQQPGHSTTRPGVGQRSEAAQAQTVAPPFVIFCFVGEFDENINAGMQIVKLKSNCTHQLRGA